MWLVKKEGADRSSGYANTHKEEAQVAKGFKKNWQGECRMVSEVLALRNQQVMV